MKNDKKIKKKNVIAFDIGTKVTKLAIGKYSNNKLNIKKIMSFDTPELSISNGRLFSINSLADKIKAVINTENIKEKYTVVNIKSTSIINRELIVPHNENEKELDQIVKYEIDQISAISMDEYLTQYQIIDEFYDEKVRMIRVLVTSIERNVVEKYLELVKLIGLKPYVLDINFNAVSKFFEINDLAENMKTTVAVIDIGFDGTNVTILQNGKYLMSRTVDHGTNTLENVFKNELNLDYNEKNFKFLITKGNEDQKILVEGAVNLMIGEVQNIIRYYVSRDSKNEVNNVFITGGISTMKSLVDYIVEEIGVELFEFNALDKVMVNYDRSYDIPTYINVLGSLVRR